MNRHVWIMALGERTRPDQPTFAEDPSPLDARACVVVDDFADLFPVFAGWRAHFAEEITTWAMRVPADAQGRPAEGWEAVWAEDGPPIRLDCRPGGFIEVRPDVFEPPRGRPLSPPAVPGSAKPAVITAV
ncbi:hypothetical protein GCM10010218_19980 [Streptomyces mashuensis]|uniref:Uncharacterized protein n=1 Tax=Streptomyces mashuensis TaxID=33904 RepID=A0A919B240_9ACTN|nr:hypothetical protein [Streptomyces mashuensis]GHF38754.1 hypothetical protein GCM10010218_19980 [Streptomyces mashuensis]